RRQRPRFQRVLQRKAQFFVIDRLADKVIGAHPQRGFHVLKLWIRSHHNDRARLAALLQLFQDFDAALTRQVNVQQNGVRRLVLQYAQHLFSVSSLDALVAAFGALPRQRPAHQFFVVHDQDFLPHHDRYFIILHEPLTGFVSRGTRLNYSTTLRALGISALLFSLFVASFDCQPLTSELLGVLVLGSQDRQPQDRKSTRLNSSHVAISYAVFCLKKKKQKIYY